MLQMLVLERVCIDRVDRVVEMGQGLCYTRAGKEIKDTIKHEATEFFQRGLGGRGAAW